MGIQNVPHPLNLRISYFVDERPQTINLIIGPFVLKFVYDNNALLSKKEISG